MTETAADPAAPQSFEQSLRRLEEIVRALEGGDAPLDQAIELFEEGNRLRQQCQKRLDEARMRIDRIAADAEGRASGMRPFDAA